MTSFQVERQAGALDGLRAVHKGTELADAQGVPRALVEASHPVIRRHPETGCPALFVNTDYTKHREGRRSLHRMTIEGEAPV